jgi:tetratricopeptide (TPR) repeat protein
MFDKADSLIKIAETKTPNSAAPALFRMQMESIKMLDRYMEDQKKIISSCLTDVADIGFIRKMRTDAASDDRKILSYLLEEYMLVMKYSKNLSGDTVIAIPACDLETIESMRKLFEKCYKKDGSVPRFTLSNALCWSYAIERKFDKSVKYIARAIGDLENMGGTYLKTRATFYNTMLAFQYLNKDTAGAIATTIKLITAHDSTGINATDYFMLATLYNRTGQYDKSIIACEKGLRAGINVSTGHRIMALNYYITGRKKQAYEQLDKSIEADKNSFDNYMVYGLILLADDRPAEAVRYFEAAWYINSGDMDLMNTLGKYFKKK